MPVWESFTWDQWDNLTWDDWKRFGMSGPTLVLEKDYGVWDYRDARKVYLYKRGYDVLIDESPDFLVMPASNAERHPSEGGYVLRRRMMFVPLTNDVVPLPGDSFRLLCEYDEQSASRMADTSPRDTFRNGEAIVYELWWVESVSKTHAMYACRCIRPELAPWNCQSITIYKPQLVNDKGTVVINNKSQINTTGRVQPVNYEDVNEQHRRMFTRFYKIWVNIDLELPHRSWVVNISDDRTPYQLLDVRSRNTMQDMTELLVAANV